MRNILAKLKNYFFSPRFHFSRFEFNLISTLLLGIGLVSGSYLALSKVFPNVFAINDTNKLWTLNTANVAQFTYDSTLVTVDDTGAHPVANVNKLTNPDFASNNSSWSLSAVAGSSTPNGWVVVPGNSTYSTSDFLAMKYEAKCAATSDPTTGLTSPDSGYHTYSDSGTACTAANSKQVVSVASGYPIANISQTNSITRCSTVSVGGSATHLINNNEWQTIARNAEGQATNWSLGAVGSGYLFAGHNDNAPALAVVASTTDTGNNACAYTDTAGTTEAPASCPTNTANNTSGTAGNQKRVLTMSNGSYIWDIPGNVWEWTNDTIQGKDQPTGATPGFNWREFTALTTYGTLTYDKVRPANALYDATYGMGRIYSDGTVSNTTVYAFIRGGSWRDPGYAGAFASTVNSTPGITNTYIGFRCASDPVAISHSFSSSLGRGAAGGDLISASSTTDAKVVQSVNVGNTSTYDISAYVYDNTAGNVGGTVSSSVASLYYNGTVVTTTYTSVGSGWYKLTGTLTGANASREYGLLVKSGKTIIADDFTLSKTGTYSVFTTTAYTNAQVNSWDSFCEGTLTGSTCTPDITASGNASVHYQLCTDNGSTCESGNSWKYYNGSAWVAVTDTTTTVNTAAQLTQSAMQALTATSQKISVKAILTFGGINTPKMPHIAIGLTTDLTAPVTTDNVSSAWNNGTVNITLSCSDSITGCATTYYTTNGDVPTTGSTAGTSLSISSPGIYTIKYFSVDTAGNTETVKTATNTVKIETTAPATGSISYTDGYYTTASVALTVADGTDGGSGLNTATRTTQRKSATLTNGTCGSYGSFATITPSGTYPDLTDSTVTTGNCYQYQYQISDNAGNQATYTNSNVAKVDTTAPATLGTPSTTTPTNSTSQTWTFTAATDAVSGVANYLWRTTGTAITSGTSAVNSVVTSLTQGIYNFFVKAVDNAGNQSAETTAGTVTVDTIGPVISDVSSGTPSDTSVTITWSTTDEIGSSIVEYGLTNSYGTDTGETDTAPRKTTHSVSISNLSMCTSYYYRVKSIDSLANESVGSESTFITSGCTGSAVVTSSNSSEVTAVSGGSVDLLVADKGIVLDVPPEFSSLDTNFQIHQIESVAALAETSQPVGYTLSNSYIYELKALTDNDTVVTTFDVPLTITIAYGASDIVGLEESSLRIYSWDGSMWTQLSDCAVDTTMKTVTCTTTHFSTFGLFGLPKSADSSDNSSSSSSTSSTSVANSAPSCSDSRPASVSDLFQIDAKGGSAKLFFTPISNIDSYYVSYSAKPTAEEHGTLATLASEGVQNFSVSQLKPNTTYYFKVRGQNGCMPGGWSNILRITTSTKGVNKKVSFYKSSVVKPIYKEVTKTVPASEDVMLNTVVQPAPRVTIVPEKKIDPMTSVQSKRCFLWWCF